MAREHVTFMINSTFYDMVAEYDCFINEVFPRLKEVCLKYDIDVGFREVAFSAKTVPADDNILLQDFRCIDEDRTFFICFRAQKLGWRPDYRNINGITVHEYPEIISFIGNVSITELAIMHALVPFERIVDGETVNLAPARHSLFYFRNPDYLKDLNETQFGFYANKSNGELKESQDLEIARAKDLICYIKRQFDKDSENNSRILIRHYDGEWDSELDTCDVFNDYTRKYSEISGKQLDDFLEIHRANLCEDHMGCLTNLTCDGRPFADVMFDDIMNELRLEYPQNFE